MKKLLILAHHAESTYRFRRELLEQFKDNGYEVHISVPDYDTIQERMAEGFIYHDVKLNRRGMNPVADYKLYRYYCNLINGLKPDIIFSYTIKPNIYGSMAASKFNVPIIPNITGLGSTFNNKKSIVFQVVKLLYKIAFRKVPVVFFQNCEGKEEFIKFNLIQPKKAQIIPGSGVNTSYFVPMAKIIEEERIRFLFIARIMKEKGIDFYLKAAQEIQPDHPNTEYYIAGMIEENEYIDRLKDLERNGVIKYLGDVADIRTEIRNADCIVLPSFYPEGMSNVLLEGAAMEKPVITTNISGCKETIEDGVTGLLCKPNNYESLHETMVQFLTLSQEEKYAMGEAGREKVLVEFDRNIVIRHYIEKTKDLVR